MNILKHSAYASLVSAIGLNPEDYGHIHSVVLKIHIYRRTKSIRVFQILLGHIKLGSTERYLGIEVDNALEMAKQTEV